MNRILIAEDEPRIVSFLEKGLRANGFTTVVAADGVTALDLARGDEVDLVILDVGLPLMDGFSVLRALRAQGRTLPVVVLTARDAVEDTVTGLSLGADDYVSKPFASRSCWRGSGSGSAARLCRPRRRPCCASAG